ncbi:MAG: hypothetical protein II944_02430 [Ruminobacter sp.]|nr:hypothetical protein [Ruminobacter sp.]
MSKNCQRMLLCGNKILRIDLHNPKINYRKSVCLAYSPRLDTLLLEQHFSKFNRYYRITRKEYDSFDSLRTEEMIDKFITEAANTGNLLFSTNPEDNNVIHQKMLEKINEENYSSFSSDNYQKKAVSDTGYHPDTEEHHSDTATPDRNFSADSRENRNESGTENGTKEKKDTVSDTGKSPESDFIKKRTGNDNGSFSSVHTGYSDDAGKWYSKHDNPLYGGYGLKRNRQKSLNRFQKMDAEENTNSQPKENTLKNIYNSNVIMVPLFYIGLLIILFIFFFAVIYDNESSRISLGIVGKDHHSQLFERMGIIGYVGFILIIFIIALIFVVRHMRNKK